MVLTNRHSLPVPLLNALSRVRYSRGPAHRSVTQLIDSPRVERLRSKHQESLETDASDRLWALMGTALHHVLELGADDQHLPEERLFAEVDGWRISGGIDLQILTPGDPPTVRLMDYKLTSVWSVIHPKKAWPDQLTMYAWLIRQAKGYVVEEAAIVAILRDWSRKESERKEDYPKAPIVVVPIPLRSPEEADAFVRERVRLHKDAQRAMEWDEALPLCSDEERWARPATFAVMKPGRKTAVRVFDTRDEAEAFVKENAGTEVVERPGEYVRCAGDYCSVSAHCEQWQQSKRSE